MRAKKLRPMFPKAGMSDWIEIDDPHNWQVTTHWCHASSVSELPGEFDGCKFVALVTACTAREEHYIDGTHDEHSTFFYCRDRAAWKLAWRLARMIVRNEGSLALILRAQPRTGGLFIEPGWHHRIVQLDGVPLLALPAPQRRAA